MAYTKNSWEPGDVITAAKLNHMEDGIAASDLSESVKTALLQIAAKVAYIDDQGQEYYDALEEALYPDKTLTGIGAVYDQSGTVYPSTSLDSLKSDLTVTAYYDDGSTAAVTTYTLSGTLTVGTSTITATYSGFTDTFEVTVSAAPTVSSIAAVYTQSGTVYDTDSLDSLKSDLVVTATYTDSITETVPSADYTLSGTLTEGTSTITVSYGGKTTTFSVTVTHVQTSEVLSVISNSSNINAATFEDTSESNNWVFEAGTLNASTVNFSWDTEECALFQIWIAQYDNEGTPYKISNKNVYATSPLTDGSQMNSWTNAGGVYYYTAIAGGNFTVTLPTSGKFKVSARRASGAGTVVNSNATFGQWLHDGGVTVTAHI